jgi:hypothetical protein
MEGLIKCSRCHSELLMEFYSVNRKGALNKCCIPCLARFKCPHCPYRCSYNSYLQRHIKMVHDKIKDLKCSICDYMTCKNSNLKHHIKAIHDKIKDFECVICPYKCSQNITLQQHIKQVHDKIKDFECIKCPYMTSKNSNLKTHIKQVHDKIKDFKCSICDYRCSTNSSLTLHIKVCTGKINCSSGELAVMNVLKALNITYLYDSSYGNVRHKGLLKWDFVIETSGEPLFIEYDGECHTLPIRYGGISQEKAESNLKSSKIRDKIKDDYCDNNGLLLLRIPYYEKENIISLVSDFVYENTL